MGLGGCLSQFVKPCFVFNKEDVPKRSRDATCQGKVSVSYRVPLSLSKTKQAANKAPAFSDVDTGKHGWSGRKTPPRKSAALLLCVSPHLGGGGGRGWDIAAPSVSSTVGPWGAGPSE